MRVLFLSRAYPPIVGGIENQNYELSVWLAKDTEMTTIANRKGKKFLPFFLPYALVRALWLMPRFDILLLGDGVLAIIGWCVKLCYPKKSVVSVVHGLDLTFKNGLYQSFWVRRFIPALDKLIAVGHETIRVGVALGIPEEKFVFIPNGVVTERHLALHNRGELEKILGMPLAGRHVLLTSGRLAKRKGVAWFIRNVMPKLPENVLYVVAGEGADRGNIEAAVAETGLASRIRLLGYVTDETREILFNTCDLFIQPNIRVAGDMEGFGISVIEASAAKIPVIASALEGLKDAISHGENGILVEPENAVAYVETIDHYLAAENERHALGERALRYTESHYHWNIIARLYASALEQVVHRNKSSSSH